jgi:hypothetical protein
MEHAAAGGQPAAPAGDPEQKMKKKGSFSNLVAALKKKGSSGDLTEVAAK